MDKGMTEKLLKLVSSDNDSDAVMGLRGLQGLFREEGVDFGKAVEYALGHLDELKKQGITIDHIVSGAKAQGPVSISGMPQCHSPQTGAIEIIAPGKTQGEVVMLQGEAANHAGEIASNLKDALVAAAINKSRFKLKLLDIKNARGETVETVLQAEYERQGMSPVRVWVNVKGEVAALATVLRKAVANSFPELVAA